MLSLQLLSGALHCCPMIVGATVVVMGSFLLLFIALALYILVTVIDGQLLFKGEGNTTGVAREPVPPLLLNIVPIDGFVEFSAAAVTNDDVLISSAPFDKKKLLLLLVLLVQ